VSPEAFAAALAEALAIQLPRKGPMRRLIVSEFMTLDGVMQAPGGKDEDRDGGFEHGGWTMPFWHDDIGKTFGALMQDADALLLGRRTYVTHAQAFEPMPPGDPFGDMMNAPKKYVVSRTVEKPIWRDTTIIRDNAIESVRALKAQPGRQHRLKLRVPGLGPARPDTWGALTAAEPASPASSHAGGASVGCRNLPPSRWPAGDAPSRQQPMPQELHG
jgi:dihydrofolate reductase